MNSLATSCKHVRQRTISNKTTGRSRIGSLPVERVLSEDTSTMSSISYQSDQACPMPRSPGGSNHGSRSSRGDGASPGSRASHGDGVSQRRTSPNSRYDSSQSKDSRQSRGSRHGEPASQPSSNPWDNNPSSNDKSVLNLHFVYVTVILCVLGLMCFLILRTKSDAGDTCKICDERVLPEPQSSPPMKRRPSFQDKIDYASDEYGAHIELHDTYYYMQREGFGAGDLLRLPSVDKVSPNVMLQDNDDCFAMQGHTGTFMIHLSRPIVVQSVTLVHNKLECDAAPKDFIIYGVKDPKEKVQVSLGRFQYENRGKLAQKFVIPSFAEIGYVGLKIVSNWGNRHFTCINKIKVHGEPQD